MGLTLLFLKLLFNRKTRLTFPKGEGADGLWGLNRSELSCLAYRYTHVVDRSNLKIRPTPHEPLKTFFNY